MTVTIMIIVALLFVVALAGGARFFYSLAAPKNQEPVMKTKVLDVFIYLGIGISLVASVTNLLQVTFAAIDRKFPDLLNYIPADSTQSDARFAIASLVVMFPIYLLLSWYASRDIEKFHYKQDMAIRKLLIYATLFITVLTLIGTLVSIIYTYLGGEINTRFLLKAASVFVVALSLFAYYYYSLKRDYSKRSNVSYVIALLAAIVVIGSVVWSISIIGTPKEMRARKIDNTRLSDISGLQQQIYSRFTVTEKIPQSLSELENAIQGYSVPTDPVTHQSYGYRVIQQPVVKMNYAANKKELVTPAIFELCATFDTVREYDNRGQAVIGKGGVMMDIEYSASNSYYEGDTTPFWNHGVGETCFKRVISADMYYGGR